MKYLKLFEGYKETTDSINKLRDKYKVDEDDIIDKYKSFIDDLLLDISDDYECNFVSKNNFLRHINQQDDILNYNLIFKSEEVDDFFKKLKDVLDRMVDVGIDYSINSLNTYEKSGETPYISHITTKPKNEMHPFCISTSKKEINDFIGSPTFAIDPSLRPTKFCIKISF